MLANLTSCQDINGFPFNMQAKFDPKSFIKRQIFLSIKLTDGSVGFFYLFLGLLVVDMDG